MGNVRKARRRVTRSGEFDRENFQQLRFTHDIKIPLAIITLFQVLFGTTFVVVMSISSRHPVALQQAAVVGAVALCGSLVVNLVLLGLMNLGFPVHIGPAGVKSYNLFGLYVMVPWREIESASSITIFPGLTYIFLRDRRSFFTCAMVPVFIGCRLRFVEAVQAYAGPDNPLMLQLVRWI